jgi:hypothetical protein
VCYNKYELKKKAHTPSKKKLKNLKKTLDKPPKVCYNKYVIKGNLDTNKK